MRELICHLSSGALVTSCCQNTFALMTNLKKRTTASHLIRNLASGERRRRASRRGCVCSGRSGGMTSGLRGERQSCKAGDEKAVELFFFLSCVSKQRESFERHLDYRVKELLF